jgi:guanylate kinase
VRRGDTLPEEIERRVSKAEYEMTFSKFADRVIVNDDLDSAKKEVLAVVEKFLNE